jgi:hypothetical protein
MREIKILNGNKLASITASLDAPSRISSNPHRLAAHAGVASKGCDPTGMGFVLSADEARELLARDGRNERVVRPYLTGEDLNSRWDVSASRWVIDFNDWPIERAMQYQEVFAIINERVRPERQRKNPDGSYVLRKPLPERWWQFADKEFYSKPHVSEKKNSPRAASYASP